MERREWPLDSITTGPGMAPMPKAHVDLGAALEERLVGQPDAIATLTPYVQMHDAGLSPDGRPAGVFLLLGPSGTGKTRTVEALAEVLHGSHKSVLRVDCGEFQQEHEIAKLLGAPPGYVGHRESQPVLTQQKLDQVRSPRSKLALVLFDEIEKAAPSLATLLLGVLDKASLRLGDGSTINFEDTLIFLTSNLGAREMLREMQPDIGFRSSAPAVPGAVQRRLESVGLAAVRKRFSPEFVNRLDAVITYSPLDREALSAILEQQVSDLQERLDRRLEHRSFDIVPTDAARRFLLAAGVSAQYGARELKRTLHRHVWQPLARLVTAGEVPPGAEVIVDAAGTGLSFTVGRIGEPRAASAPRTVLVVDDNEALVGWVAGYLAEAGCRVLRAGSVKEAEAWIAGHEVDAAFIDQLLPDGDGVQLAMRLHSRTPNVFSIVMTGGHLSEEARALCRRFAVPVLTKPFPGTEMLTLIDTGERAASNSAR
jgi:ATP-dependent Clp protease ATP-binding subunit ClpA/ActR/RegA family two-component response regulator